MTDYGSIDPVLLEWAKQHSFGWLTDYQDYEVRTFFLNEGARDKVQIWVDPPRDGMTAVHVVQYQIGGKKKRSDDFVCNVSQVSNALDQALAMAEGWLAD